MKIDDLDDVGQVKMDKKEAVFAALVFLIFAFFIGGLSYISFFREKAPKTLEQKTVSEVLNLEEATATPESLNKDSTNADNDGDGLENWAEAAYKTDKDSKDTDGDGYSDFQEINSGFNPLGDGKLDARMLSVKKSVEKNREVFEKIEVLKKKADLNQATSYEKNKTEKIFSLFEKLFSVRGFIVLVVYLFSIVIFLAFYAFVFNLICGRIFGIIEANAETSLKIVAIHFAVVFVLNFIVNIVNFFMPNIFFPIIAFLGGIILSFVTLNKLLTKYYRTTLGQNVKVIITTYAVIFIIIGLVLLLIKYLFLLIFGLNGGLSLM